MSIFKMETAIFTFISNKMAQYGLPIEFRYDDNLDLLEEFRKSIRLRIEHQNTYDALVKQFKNTSDPNDPNFPAPGSPPSKEVHSLALYNRTPIRKSEVFGNNIDLQVYSKKINDEYGIELRGFTYGEIDYTVKVLFDTHEMSDMFELLYLAEFANKERAVSVDYNLGDGVESLDGVDYVMLFQQTSDVASMNDSDTLRSINFSFTLKGPFFLPFYQDSYRLETIVLSIHAMYKGVDPTPANATDANKIDSETFTMPINLIPPVDTK